MSVKTDILARLQKEILPLQGFKAGMDNRPVSAGLGAINNAFPNRSFPVGAIHEFISDRPEDTAATNGFVATILHALMETDAVVLWLSATRQIFPPALPFLGIEPGRIIFIDLPKEKLVLWALEESLKCEGVAAVVGELKEISFTESRRLQLAVEQSRVTGFLLRSNPKNVSTTACVSRWKISSLASETEDGMPGVGFARWNVQLLKVRNGQPGNWQVEWNGVSLRHTPGKMEESAVQHLKTG